MLTKAFFVLCGGFFVGATLQFVYAAPAQSKTEDDVDRDPDPITRNLESTEEANVKDLESLKHSIGKTFELMKSQTAAEYANQDIKNSNNEDLDSRRLTASTDHPQATSNENVQPTEPKTAAVKENFTKNGNRRGNAAAVLPYNRPSLRAPPDVDKAIGEAAALAAVAAVDDIRNQSGDHGGPNQYTSLDMAEYIFWTGDEKGVSDAIEEFLHEGLMSREEAVTFLQEIKYNLMYLQAHYSKMGLNSIKGQLLKDDAASTGTSSAVLLFSKDKQRINGKPTLNTNLDIMRLRQEPVTKKDLHARFAADNTENTDAYPRSGTSSSPVQTSAPNPSTAQAIQMLFDKLQEHALADLEQQPPSRRPATPPASPESNTLELLDRLHTADMLYTEYSLEEVIYQLARVMFQQALMKGNAEAQQTLQRFTLFLETEAEQARISRSLEKTVFDVLIAALADTFSEHPELTSTGPSLAQSAAVVRTQNQQQRVRGPFEEVPMGDRNAILRQILQMGAEHTEYNHLGGIRNDLGPMRIAINTVKYKTK